MDAILITSIKGKIIFANPSAEDLFGYSEDEMKKLVLSELVNLDEFHI